MAEHGMYSQIFATVCINYYIIQKLYLFSLYLFYILTFMDLFRFPLIPTLLNVKIR